MNYLLASNNAVLKFPYSLAELRNDNPQTSFTWEMSAEELAEWGVFAVEEEVAPACNEQTESIALQSPSLVNGVWGQGWLVVAASAEEIERRTTAQSNQIRETRNQYLARTDRSQLADFPGTAELQISLTQVRQQLRDVPQQSGFPWAVVWPGLDEEEI